MSRSATLIFAILLLATPVGLRAADRAPVTYSCWKPGEVWTDTSGLPINAHGGGMLYHQGCYYWYGENKEGRTWLPESTKAWDGYRVDVTGIRCYSSCDLLNWKDEGLVLKPVSDNPAHDLHPSKVCERPKVLFNPHTKKFVMWLHIDSEDYKAARAGVAVADSPTGPFTYLESVRPEGQDSRDQTLFQDDDGKAYRIYSSENNATTYISLLTDDYLKHSGRFTRVFVKQKLEAQVVFKSGGKYWLVASHCTGWDPNPARSAVADSIWGPWTELGNPCRGRGSETTFGGQSAFVFPVAGQSNAFIFMADRWNKNNLPDSRYLWLPLRFTEKGFEVTWHEAWGPEEFGSQHTSVTPDALLSVREKFKPAPLPPAVPFAFRPGDRLAICGDSITEARKYARMLESYLTVCRPELEVSVRNHGLGGEMTDGFLKRMQEQCLRFKPTVATICYGMNDSRYVGPSDDRARKFHDNYAAIVRNFQETGVRVVVGSPGCIGKLPPWEFVRKYGGTEEKINLALGGLRNQTAAVAGELKMPFADVFTNLLHARFEARNRFGPDYALCGASDGVHPDWAGHVVMAYSFFKALGFDGDLGTITVDLASGKAVATKDHHVDSATTGSVTLTSRRYPFCAEGALDKEDSIRSGMTLVPFNREFNRLTLKVTGAAAANYGVTWGSVSRSYSVAQLAEGVNLAEDFPLNPFSEAFGKVDAAVEAKQLFDKDQRKLFRDADVETAVQRSEAERVGLVSAVKKAFVPVTHTIRISPL